MEELLYFFCVNIYESPFSKSLTCPILILVANFYKLCGLQKVTKVVKKWSSKLTNPVFVISNICAYELLNESHHEIV